MKVYVCTVVETSYCFIYIRSNVRIFYVYEYSNSYSIIPEIYALQFSASNDALLIFFFSFFVEWRIWWNLLYVFSRLRSAHTYTVRDRIFRMNWRIRNWNHVRRADRTLMMGVQIMMFVHKTNGQAKGWTRYCTVKVIQHFACATSYGITQRDWTCQRRDYGLW
jgi:hypothetical protein